ncbi:MAG: hypothetical protein ACK5MR_01610 [Cumulibacter sp.]
MSAQRKSTPNVDITQTDELGLTASSKKANIAAWSLSAFVIIVGVVALIATGQKIFILFIVLGVITPLNVVAYDNFVLKPKIAKLKADRAKELEAEARADDDKESE